jgi:hypothetical protein
VCDVVCSGFIGTATRLGVFTKTLTVGTPIRLVDQWLSLPHAHALSLCERRRTLSLRWMSELAVVGNLSTAPLLKALAHRKHPTVCTNAIAFPFVAKLSLRNLLMD